jgi:hypothetical protein
MRLVLLLLLLILETSSPRFRESPLKFLHGCAPTVLILLRVIFAESGVKRKKYASPHLVYLRRLPRGLRGQGAHAYASIDHMDSGPRYCRLDHRRRRDSSVLPAQCGRQISSRRIDCFNRWGASRFVHLAQVQTSTATGITSLIWN